MKIRAAIAAACAAPLVAIGVYYLPVATAHPVTDPTPTPVAPTKLEGPTRAPATCPFCGATIKNHPGRR